MVYEQVIDNCFEENIGSNGIKRSDFEENLNKAQNALSDIIKEKESGNFPILNHLCQDVDIEEIIKIGNEISSNFDELVVLGTGGSTLNPQSMVCLNQPHEGVDKRVYFIDSVDPHTIESFSNQLDLATTAFLVTSKSGSTVETLSQFLCFLDLLEQEHLDVGKHIYIISDPKQNPIRSIGEKIGATIIDHVKDIGGRFSTYTNVGLIPAVVAGSDIKKIRQYAKEAAESFLKPDSIPVIGAAIQYSFIQKGTPITVMMPYIDRLSYFAKWYRQIWAESLGKNGKGSTPIKAIGALDQHSQLQLYLDGPKDKLFNLITCATENNGPKISGKYLNKSMSYLKGKNIGEINAALQKATAETLVNNNCPLRHIKIDNMNEEVLSKIMLHFMLETIITAKLLDLNPFDQPAVEEGKVLAHKILSS
jgi:glucose-6-phosphate isomerase